MFKRRYNIAPINYNRYTKFPVRSVNNPRGQVEIIAENNNPMGQTFIEAIKNRCKQKDTP